MCSPITFHGFSFSSLAITKLNMPSNISPHAMLTSIAVDNSRSIIGIMKVNAKTNFAANVAIVDSHISRTVCFVSASSDMCMPSASEKASATSATAIVIMPPRMTIFECVLESSPTIRPSVVMIPDVRPKLKPFLQNPSCYYLSSELKYHLIKKYFTASPMSRTSITVMFMESPIVARSWM
jgi:hypothetical protein